MITEVLIDELVLARQGALSREDVELHVRLGRGHGYPDCCIKDFVLALGTAQVTISDEDNARIAKRRLCKQCEANMNEQAEVPAVRRQRDIEIAFSGLRTRVNDIINERRKTQPDAAAIEGHFNEIRKWVNKLYTLRTTPIDGETRK